MAKKGRNKKKTASTTWDSFQSLGKTDVIALFVLVLATLFVYSGGSKHEFVHWDDNEYVFENESVMSDQTKATDFFKADFPDLLAVATRSKDRSEIDDSGIVVANYHPITMVSLWWNWQSGTGEFSPFFQTNKWLHLLNALLVYLFVLRLYPSRWVAFFSALIFALHPMHVESVAWISERKDVLYTFFFLSGLIAYDRFLDKKNIGFYAGAFALFVLSCLSKPAAVVFPVAAFALAFYRRNGGFVKVLIQLTPFLVLSVFFGLITLGAQAEAINDSDNFTFFDRLTIGFWANSLYLLKFIAPGSYATMHPIPGSIRPIFYVGWLVTGAFFAITAFLALSGRKLLAFGLAFYFITILLVLQILGVGSAIIAERYTYVPYIGLALVLLVAIHKWVDFASVQRKTQRISASAILGLFILFLAFQAKGQMQVWKDSNALWSQVVEEYPNAYLGYKSRGYYQSILAVDLGNNSLFSAAIADYDQAIPRATKSDQLTELHTIKGYALFALGRDEEAVVEYNSAVEYDAENWQAISNRGVALVRLGRYTEAFPDLNNTIDHREYGAQSLKARSVAYFKIGDYRNTVSDVDLYLQLKPEELDMRNQKGVALINLGEYEKAIQALTMAIDMSRGNHPSLKSFYSNRALAYQLSGRIDEANRDRQRAANL